jgi:tetratricopeptide (TPR) repeat protein
MLSLRGKAAVHRPAFSVRWLVLVFMACQQPLALAQEPAYQGKLISTEGQVQFSRQKADWSAANVGQNLQTLDRVRTLALSRALVQLMGLGRLRLQEQTTLEVLPPRNTKSKGTLDLKSGLMYFFTRDRPQEFEVQTPKALAASRGTEFLVAIEPSGRERFQVFDGEVEVSNPLGTVTVFRGEEGVVDAGQPPRKTAVIESSRIVQWWLYFAAVVDADELSLTDSQRRALAGSLDAYRQGDLPHALETYPAGRTPENDAEKVFYAQLLLSIGQVEKADTLLVSNNTASASARALRLMMDTVQGRETISIRQPTFATEWLANSYYLQAQFNLESALVSARRATEISPNFGFGWVRVAELEFSRGRNAEAAAALSWGLTFSPRNAQGWALKGFMLSAQREWREAEDAFSKAIALDPALGNGWLGRGLLKIHWGDQVGGRDDLQTAAALEPNRSLLRSYLGKAFDNVHDQVNAARELALAKQLDANDPTPWLYSALILRQQLRYNEAVSDLEQSAALNTNRFIYRSRLLLDQDQAVRSASLATIYRAAGLDDVSVREAAGAVVRDYANHSAHQFLAESFDAMRDPTRFNLRVETAWFNELLLANLLAPVGGGNLSQNISQQEYSRLFEVDHVGFSSSTEYRSDGQVRELTSQFGTIDDFSYALDLDYQHNDGVRPNNELDRIEWYTTAKYQLTAQDSLFLLMKYQDYKSGDNFQYYDPAASGTIRTNFSFEEYQHPLLAIAYHREWSPGVHTLLLGARLENDQRFRDTGINSLLLQTNGAGKVIGDATLGLDASGNDIGGVDVFYRNRFETYSGELNQIFQTERNTLVLGGRMQAGEFRTSNLMTNVQPPGFAPFFLNPPADNTVVNDFKRAAAYGYYTIRPLDNIWFTVGLSYDHLVVPINHRVPPISSEEVTRHQLGPKASLVWSPLPEVTVRGMYARSIGGVSFDESFRLEPTQLAGFIQSYRSIIPESVVGSVSAPVYDVAGAALDLKFKSQMYIGFSAGFLKADVDDDIGVFAYPTNLFTPLMSVVPSTTSRHLKYEEPSAAISLNELISDSWSFGAQYRYTRSTLQTVFPELVLVDPNADHTEHADLQTATLFALWNHASGFFARAESQWYHQENHGCSPALASEDFWQHNLIAGYHLKRQRGDLSLGVLNLADANYHLNPLNPYSELPRERVFIARLKLNF